MPSERMAIIYDRASSPGQKDNYARADAARLGRLAEERGLRWDLRQEIKSGEDISNRPVMRAILDEIAEGRIAALIVQDFTRLSRDEDGIDGRIIRQFCRDHACLIVTPEKVYDFETDADDDLADIQFLVGKWQKRANLRAMTRGMVERARQGHFLPSTAPFGYDVVIEMAENGFSKPVRRWRINDTEADVVRLIHQLYGTMTIREIGLHLNEHVGPRPIKNKVRQSRLYSHVDHAYRVEDAPTPRTHRAWTRIDVREVLSPDGNAELYAGFVTWGTESRSRYTRGLEPIVVHRPELQIISVEQLNRTKRLLAERARIPPRSAGSRYVFSSILRCSRCGGAMTGKFTKQARSGVRIPKYVCRLYQDAGKAGCAGQSLQESTIRPIVVEFLSELFETRLRLGDFLDDAARSLDGGSTEGQLYREVAAELHEVDAAIGRLVDAISNGVIAANQAKEKNLELLERKERLQRRLDESRERAGLRVEMADAFAVVGGDVRGLINDLDDASFKRLVRLVLNRFSITGTRRGQHFDGQIGNHEFSPAFNDLLSHSITSPRRRIAGRARARAPSSPASAGGPRRCRSVAPVLRTAAARPGSP
ncbi:MAG: recombinase family protein, partial [Chloroflexota bacterium]|nr:recombinase family protein [Chloroflexota bacterium]